MVPYINKIYTYMNRAAAKENYMEMTYHSKQEGRCRSELQNGII